MKSGTQHWPPWFPMDLYHVLRGRFWLCGNVLTLASFSSWSSWWVSYVGLHLVVKVSTLCVSSLCFDLGCDQVSSLSIASKVHWMESTSVESEETKVCQCTWQIWSERGFRKGDMVESSTTYPRCSGIQLLWGGGERRYPSLEVSRTNPQWSIWSWGVDVSPPFRRKQSIRRRSWRYWCIYYYAWALQHLEWPRTSKKRRRRSSSSWDGSCSRLSFEHSLGKVPSSSGGW